jgi:thiol:disulfide interchange protein
MIKYKPWSLLLFLALAVLTFSVAVAQTDTATETIATDTITTETTETTTTETTTEQTTTYYEDDDNADKEGALACAMCGGVGLVFFLIPLALSAIIAWWIHRDATRSGNPNAVLWAVLGFFLNVVGLIIYLIVRPKGGAAAPPTAPTV